MSWLFGASLLLSAFVVIGSAGSYKTDAGIGTAFESNAAESRHSADNENPLRTMNMESNVDLEGQENQMSADFAQRRAGMQLSDAEISKVGVDNLFNSSEIDDTLFARIEGKSFPQNCTTARSELRYLRILHRDLEGRTRVGEMICNRSIADDLLTIFRTLYDARYPIQQMVLIDRYDADDERSMQANNSSAFNFRFVAGTKQLSNHSRGLAVDINPLYNPYVRTANGRTIVEPSTAVPYADRTRTFPCKIDKNDLCYKEFIRHGFSWGGDWKTRKDYQHFQKEQ